MAFLIFSGATSLTAPEIAVALHIQCGRELPRNGTEIIINYGAGNFNVPTGTRKVINHPQYMKNKLSMLQHLKNIDRVSIPKFCTPDRLNQAIRDGTLKFPIIGRTTMHQAGGGFWLCLSKRVADWAIEHGASYFQQWKDIKTEYRVHVFGNEDLGVYKKVLRQNPKDDFCRMVTEEVLGEREGLRAEDINHIIKKAVKHFVNPDFNIRSLHRGWKFVKDENPPRNLVTMAINAVKSTKLDFAAVDMMLLEDNTAEVIELNTGPGMDVGGPIFNKYVEKFRIEVTKPLPQPKRILTTRGTRLRKRIL
jgi:hypothetical protein